MPADDDDLIGRTAYGQAALRKLAPVPAGFRLYRAEWLGKKPADWREMRVTGGEFRAALSGARRGKLVIPVAGTVRSVVLTRAEVLNAEEST